MRSSSALILSLTDTVPCREVCEVCFVIDLSVIESLEPFLSKVSDFCLLSVTEVFFGCNGCLFDSPVLGAVVLDLTGRTFSLFNSLLGISSDSVLDRTINPPVCNTIIFRFVLAFCGSHSG